MAGRTRDDYKRFIMIAYNVSNDGLRITIPDTIKFAGTVAHCHLKDQSHLVVDTNPTEMTTFSRKFSRSSTYPGTRTLLVMHVKHIGAHFRNMATTYQVEGSRLIIKIPDEHLRMTPNRIRRRAPKPKVEQKPIQPDPVSSLAKTIAEGEKRNRDRGTVLVEMGEDHFETLEFSIPKHELVKIILEWTEKRWRR